MGSGSKCDVKTGVQSWVGLSRIGFASASPLVSSVGFGSSGRPFAARGAVSAQHDARAFTRADQHHSREICRSEEIDAAEATERALLAIESPSSR